MLRIIISFLVMGFSFSASAKGMAEPGQYGFIPAASPVMEQLAWLHDQFLMPIITAITILVMVLMIYIVVRFNRKANPVASKTTHNVKLEVIWTILPIIILVAIAIPSVRIHNFMEAPVEGGMTLKVTGYQWYWGYEYPDQGGINFESRIIEDKDLKEGDIRLLSVDNPVVIPVNTKVRVQTTAADVIHAWALPAFGVKRDAMPGRLNETWFEATKEGRYYGQCSELCGVKHGFMPIVVDVVSQDAFNVWVADKQKAAGIVPAVANMKEAVASEKPADTKPQEVTATPAH